MAETYGTDTHEHDGEYGDEQHDEHGAVSEAPSDYEFSDESGATADVEHNDEILASEEKSTRRSPVLPIVAVVGGVLLLGGVAWWQFGGHAAEPAPFPGSTPVPFAATTPAPATPPPPTVKLSATPPPPSAPLPVTPRVASTPQMEISDGTAPAPALPSGSATPAAPTTPGVPPSAAIAANSAPTIPAVPVVAAPAPTPATPVVAPAALAMAPVSPVVPTPTPTPAIAPVAIAATEKAQMDALNQHINDLQAKLDHVTQQMSQMMNMVAASAGTTGASPEIQARLSRIEQQVATLHTAKPPHTRLEAVANADNAPEASAVPQDAAPEKPVVHHTATHHKPHRKPVASASEIADLPPPAEMSRSWVLRAATPGHAWLATSAESHDLKAVQVGDKLPGVGQVTSIQQQGNSWIVQGTKGVIR